MDEGNFTFAISLQINGQLVSGTPVSRRAYLHGLGDVFGESEAIEHRARMRFRRLFDEVAHASEDVVQERMVGEHERSRTYIHLEDAVIIAGDLTTPVPFWRGRVSAVSAWFPGRVEVTRR